MREITRKEKTGDYLPFVESQYGFAFFGLSRIFAHLAGNSRRFSISNITQSSGDGEPRGANSRKNSADDSNEHGPNNCLNQEFRTDSKGKSDLAESLPVHGGCLKPVESQIRR